MNPDDGDAPTATQGPSPAKSTGTKPAAGKAGGRGARRPAAASPRRRAREIALQGLYQWLLAGTDARSALAALTEQDGFDKADRVHLDALLHGCIDQAAALDAVIARHADRKTALLSPVEHAALLIGCYELQHCLDVPYRVAINEAVELAKSFGGTDGHKFVNGVLDRCAGDLRPLEAGAPRR